MVVVVVVVVVVDKRAHILHAEIETKTRKAKNQLKYIAVCVSKL